MKKIIILITLIIILGIIFFGIKNEKERTSLSISGKPVVKIGASLPLTGGAGSAGQAAKESLKMIMKKWENQNTKYNYKLIIEDDRLDPKTTSMIGNKLMNLDKVNGIISMWGLSSKIFTEANNISKNPIPHLTCSWGTSLTNGKYNFNNVPRVSTYARILAEKLKTEKVKNIGLIFQNSSSDIEMQEGIIKELEKININIVFNEIFNIGEKNYRMFISKIKDKPVDIIYFQLLEEDLQAFHKQLIEFNIDTPLATIDYYEDIEDASPFEGYWFITSSAGDRNFIERFKTETKMNIRGCTLNLYDNVDILIYAFENAIAEEDKIPTSESVLKYLQSMKTWDGVSGDLIFREDGHIDYEPKLAIIKNGKVELLEE